MIYSFENMSTKELRDARQGIADDIGALINARLEAAIPLETLSDRGDKLLQVVQEANGQKLVIRRFTADAVSVIEDNGLGFDDAWKAMHKQFIDAGIVVLPSQLLVTEGEYPFTVVATYLENGQALIEGSLKLKMELAYKLGKMLRGRYMLHPQMLNEDMFMIETANDESEEVYLIDLDPIMMPRPITTNIAIFPGRQLDAEIVDGLDASYIDQLTRLFSDRWCKDGEKTPVLSTLFASLKESLGPDGDSQTARAHRDLLLRASSLNN